VNCSRESLAVILVHLPFCQRRDPDTLAILAALDKHPRAPHARDLSFERILISHGVKLSTPGVARLIPQWRHRDIFTLRR
jgi:hypothetical protein